MFSANADKDEWMQEITIEDNTVLSIRLVADYNGNINEVLFSKRKFNAKSVADAFMVFSKTLKP